MIQSENNITVVDFDNIYAKDITLFIPILASLFNILFVTPIYCSIIWYERFGTDHRRSLLNQLVASTCWNGALYNLISIPLEVILSLFGPFGDTFCSVQMVVKNAGVFHVANMIISITLTKYLSIFVLKNPLAVKSEFWCFFINLVSTFGPLLSEIVFTILPGKPPMNFYVCKGTYSTSLDLLKPKKDYPLFAAIALSFLFYIFVLVRVKVFKKNIIEPSSVPVTPLNQVVVDCHAMANLETIGQSVFTFLPLSIAYSIINRIPLEQLASFPNYFLVHFLHHGISLLWNIVAIIIFLSKSKAMWIAIFREFSDLIKKLRDWTYRICHF